MEYWGPWSSFYKKSGGTIAGNVHITGTLDVDGDTTINSRTIIKDQVRIEHDDPVGASPHVTLADATPAGLVNSITTEPSGGGFKGAFAALDANTICIIPAINGVASFPCDALGGAPTWKVPNLTDPLDARRMMMLHSLMFGL